MRILFDLKSLVYISRTTLYNTANSIWKVLLWHNYPKWPNLTNLVNRKNPSKNLEFLLLAQNCFGRKNGWVSLHLAKAWICYSLAPFRVDHTTQRSITHTYRSLLSTASMQRKVIVMSVFMITKIKRRTLWIKRFNIMLLLSCSFLVYWITGNMRFMWRLAVYRRAHAKPMPMRSSRDGHVKKDIKTNKSWIMIGT